MITFWIVLGFFALIGIIHCIAERKKLFEGIFIMIFWGMAGGLIGAISATTIPADGEKYVAETWKLSAIQDNSEINGKFILGSGNFNGTMSYMFYYEKNGVYRLDAVNCRLTTIEYTNGESRIEILDVRRTNTKHNRYTLANPDITGERYKFYIPEGSIKFEINLDAK